MQYFETSFTGQPLEKVSGGSVESTEANGEWRCLVVKSPSRFLADK